MPTASIGSELMIVIVWRAAMGEANIKNCENIVEIKHFSVMNMIIEAESKN